MMRSIAALKARRLSDVFPRVLLHGVQLFALLHFGALITHNPYRAEFNHYDEPNWMWVSHQAWDTLVRGAWSDPFWHEPHAGWGSFSPNLGKYFIGAPLHHYLKVNPDKRLHRFGSFGTNLDPTVLPDFEMYHPARVQSAAFMALSTLVVIDIAASLFNPLAGALSGLLFLFHPYVISNSFRAMTDACALFGTVVCLWGLVRKRDWAIGCGVGLGLGWAAATRANGLLVGIAALAALLFEAFRTHRWSQFSLRAGLAVFLGSAVVYGTNPHLLRYPIRGLWEMLSAGPDGAFAFTGKIGNLLHVFSGLFFFTSSTGPVARPGPWFTLLTLAFLSFGIAAVRRTVDLSRRRFLHATVVLWALLLLLIPRDWDRYYLAAVPAIAVFAGYGLSTFFTLIWPSLRSAIQSAQTQERQETDQRQEQ